MAENVSETAVYIRMKPEKTWHVFDVKDVYEFVSRLDSLFPQNAVLYIEGSSIAGDVAEFLAAHSIQDNVLVEEDPNDLPPPQTLVERILDRIFPSSRGDIYRLPLTCEILEGLSRFWGNHAESEVADHVNVYRGRAVLMEGYDWSDGSYYISTEIPEECVRDLCLQLGCRYELSDY